MTRTTRARPNAFLGVFVALTLTPGCGGDADAGPPGDLTDGEVEQLARLAYPYVAL